MDYYLFSYAEIIGRANGSLKVRLFVCFLICIKSTKYMSIILPSDIPCIRDLTFVSRKEETLLSSS